jgi:hypothetical protein
MTAMIGAPAIALFNRPTTPALAVAVVAVVGGWLFHLWSDRPIMLGDDADDRGDDRRPSPLPGHALEPPAVVALLTNGFDVPPSAITATALDLAARGWVRLAIVDDELVVVTRGQGAAGDLLLPYEQQVLAHLASRAFNDVSSASTLALSQHRLDRRWMQRFSHAVAAHGRTLDLTERRHSVVTIAPGAGAAGVAVIALTYAVTRGSDVDVSESWRPRLLAVAALVAAVALAVRTFERAGAAAQRPKPGGSDRALEWLRYRRRLRARIPGDAHVMVPPPQLSALAVACVMGVAEQVHEQLPVAPEEPRAAWSESGGRAHRVRVRYPIRPGYGQHPLKVAVVGAVVLVVARLLQNFLDDVADGEQLTSLLDRVPGQLDLIESIASTLSIVCWIPLAWAAWSVLAGLVDCVATRERTGLVVRTRRPSDVVGWANLLNPFADRDRYSTYLALDDGRRRTVTAWLATDRTAAPQGAQARVRATPLLGFVRSSEPVGTAARAAVNSR